MAYVFLVAAIAAAGAVNEPAAGLERLHPAGSAAVLAAYGLSFVFLAQVVKELPVGVVYAVWSGLGTATIVAIGAAFLGQPLTPVTVAGVGLIIAGVVVLQVGGAH